MDDGSRSGFLAALVLLFFAMICAVTETSIASVSRVKVKTASDRGDRKAARVLYVLDHFDKAITTILICTNIVHLSIASIVTTAVTRTWGLSAVSISTIITTFAVFYAGEMLPKSVAKKYSFYFAKATSGILVFFMKILSPLSAALAALSAFVSAKRGGEGEKTVTEDELQDIIEDMTEEGSLDEEQGELVSSALQFVEVTVQDILTPRVDMVALDIDSSPEEALKFIKMSSHSRIPVYEKTVDNIIGILHVRSFIKAYMKGNAEEIRPLLEEAYFIKGSTPIHDLLPLMSRDKQSLAMVTDPRGGILGLVTIEDILEELVGEIWDEDDVIPPEEMQSDEAEPEGGDAV